MRSKTGLEGTNRDILTGVEAVDRWLGCRNQIMAVGSPEKTPTQPATYLCSTYEVIGNRRESCSADAVQRSADILDLHLLEEGQRRVCVEHGWRTASRP